jgi:hypothetical protein
MMESGKGRFLDGVIMQICKRYRLREKILAIRNDGKQVVEYVPAQSVVDVQEISASDAFVNVTWNGRPYKVFTQDLENRSDLLCRVEAPIPFNAFVKRAGA